MPQRQVGFAAPVWRKSTRSNGGEGCVELAVVDVASDGAPHKVEADKLYLVRDSKNPDGPVLGFAPGEWEAFIGGVKNGEFDPEGQG
ncbi:DUF397 domain-containing protein [Sphaerisporangium sp. NPDC049003]|uniref:DUF397 domain-containing protein n=1 Tax=Sphaerisporangium sp. NPDC049003 TaxID=3364517 RepID=UPI003711A811